MPTERVSFSNQNYRFVDRQAETRGISFSKAVNDYIEDARARASSPQVRARRAIESGDQMVLFDVGV